MQLDWPSDNVKVISEITRLQFRELIELFFEEGFKDAGEGADTANDANIGIGHFANNAVSSGDYNIALGSNSLKVNSIGKQNIAIGKDSLSAFNAGNFNIAIGNGSEVIIMYSEWGTTNQFGDFKGLELKGLQVLNLQEYNEDVGFAAVSVADVEEF